MITSAGIRLKPLPIDENGKADAVWNDFLSDLAQIGTLESAAGFLKSALVNAPFLRDCLIADPDFAAKAFDAPMDEKIAVLIAAAGATARPDASESDVMRELRFLKKRIAVLLAFADLGGIWTCAQVTKALSDFADAALLSAVRFSLIEEEKRGKIALANRDAPERESGLIVLAMGKHGARELNYSSDIDIVVFYDPSRIDCVDRHELQGAMVRVAKRVVKIMQERTQHGYVFRTDLRLRPDPGATAVAISNGAALHYYESLGQNWERAAFIKARPVACDIDAADAFLAELSPFVWRKYMDFATIADVHAMKRQTHRHKGHGEIAIRGHNVKLGRGGIREIEFFVQTQQLIAGGRNPALRMRGTLDMLALLAQAGWIDAGTAQELARHYVFLRNIEHRIQMRHDEQTHILPTDDEGFAAVCRMMGYAENAAFERDLLACLESVSRHYAKLFEEEDAANENRLVFTREEDDPETLDALSRLGFENVRQISGIVRGWHQGHYRAVRTKRAQGTLTQIAPKLLQALSKTAQPDNALFAFDAFLKSLPAGIQLFSLLRANEHLLDLIAQLMGSAPRLSATIARHPHIFDALLEPAFFGSVPARGQLRELLRTTLGEAVDYQDILDRVRIFTQEQQFLIGTRLLSGTITIAQSQALYADLADIVIVALLEEVLLEVSRVHGDVPGGDIAVLAMGKLGGCEMSPTSDLDLILIYEAPSGVERSQGKRPLAVSQYYARVTQRFIAALSAPTGEGIAYPVDMRLRPSGKAGPLATDIDGFAAYQRESAWTWEHMALTRARAVGGSVRLRAKIDAVIHDVLTGKRDEGRLRADIAEMNERLHEAKAAKSVWNVKDARGGLIDVEFLAQFYQLKEASARVDILSPNTAQALWASNRAGVLDDGDFKVLRDAHDLYSSVIQLMRLCFEGVADPENMPADLVSRLCACADVPDLSRLEAAFETTREAVMEIFARTLGEVE